MISKVKLRRRERRGCAEEEALALKTHPDTTVEFSLKKSPISECSGPKTPWCLLKIYSEDFLNLLVMHQCV